MTAKGTAFELVVTPKELAEGRRYVEETTAAVRAAVEGLSEAQLRFQPAVDRWSIAQNLEHMAVVQELVLGPIREQLAAAPEVQGGSDPRVVDALVRQLLPERTRRFPAPQRAVPSGNCGREEALDRLERNGARLIEWLETSTDLRRHKIESRPLTALTGGAHTEMDGYQWILGAAAHTERHTRQIQELKADPAFATA